MSPETEPEPPYEPMIKAANPEVIRHLPGETRAQYICRLKKEGRLTARMPPRRLRKNGPMSPAVVGKMSIANIFLARMRREGRGSEYEAEIRRIMQLTGRKKPNARWEAMRTFGYTTPARERTLFRAWEASLVKTPEELELAKLKAAEKESALAEAIALATMDSESAFQAAVRKLPNSASLQVEWEWIGAHPAMMRMDRTTEKMKGIKITVDDVLNAPHGPAPSKRAVAQLQHWCIAPREFFKALIGVSKKQVEGDQGGQSQAEDDEDLAEIERLLKEVRGGGSPGNRRVVTGVGPAAASSDRAEAGRPEPDDREGAAAGDETAELPDPRLDSPAVAG